MLYEILIIILVVLLISGVLFLVRLLSGPNSSYYD